MKLRKQLTAITLALLLAVGGLPAAPAASADEPDPTPAKPRMTFTQKNFDTNTGILTMALKVLVDPIVLAEEEIQNNVEADHAGHSQRVLEGYFAFRYDAASMVPLTRKANAEGSKELTAGSLNRNVMLVYNPGSAAMESFVDSVYNPALNIGGRTVNEYNEYIGLNFSDALTEQMEPPLKESSIVDGYLVSTKRVTRTQRLADAYVQFGFKPSYTPANDETYDQTADADGYVTVLELDFQCYDGVEDMDGITQRKKAENTSFLYANSFTPIQAEDLASFQEQFMVNGKTLVQGSAGYYEGFRRRPSVSSTVATYKVSMYHYGALLAYEDVQWPLDDASDSEYPGYLRNPEDITMTLVGDTIPTLSFDRDDIEYSLTGFDAMMTNVFAGDVKNSTAGDPPDPSQDADIVAGSVAVDSGSTELDALFNGNGITVAVPSSISGNATVTFTADEGSTITLGGEPMAKGASVEGLAPFTGAATVASLRAAAGVSVVVSRAGKNPFTYTLKDISAQDTYGAEDDEVDFVVPEGENGRYPRYDIPTYDEEQENKTNGDADAWVPRSHDLNKGTAAAPEYVKPLLKYYINADVAAGAVSYPQKTAEMRAAFMNSLDWAFYLDDGTSLEELTEQTVAGPVSGTDAMIVSAMVNGAAATFQENKILTTVASNSDADIPVVFTAHKDCTITVDGIEITQKSAPNASELCTFTATASADRVRRASGVQVMVSRAGLAPYTYTLRDTRIRFFKLSDETDAGTVSVVDKNGSPVTYTVKEVTIQANVTRYECSNPTCSHTADTEWTGACPICHENGTATPVQTTPYSGTNNLAGSKLWRLYSGSTYVMTTPVGVALDYLPTTVSYRDMDAVIAGTAANGTIVEENDVRAPQLHVTHEAASEDNVIWKMGTAGVVTLGVSYGRWTQEIKTRLYKERSRQETSVELSAGQLLTESGTSDPAYFYVGNSEIDGTGETAIADALSDGISLRAVLYDQYHAAYSSEYPTIILIQASKLEEIREAQKTQYKNDNHGVDPTEEVLDALVDTAVAGLVSEQPFVITRDRQVQEENYQDLTADINDYTIKYSNGKGVNDVTPGDYVLTAFYTRENGQVVRTQIPVEVKKEADHLHYISVSLTGAKSSTTKNASWSGKTYSAEIDAVYQVPTRISNGNGSFTIATETALINLEEIANQWREESFNAAQYDVTTGLRDENGAISLASCASRNVKVTFAMDGFDQTSGPSAGQPKIGLAAPSSTVSDSVRYLTNGSFNYGSTVADGTAFACNLTVKYPGDADDNDAYFAKLKINFTFLREINGLQAIEINSADITDQNPHTINVPLEGESAATKVLEIVAKDMYGSTMLWTGPKSVASYSGGDGKYTINTVDANGNPVSLPASAKVRVDSISNSVIVDPLAPDRTIYLQASYALTGTKSAPYMIHVARQSSKPATVQDAVYDTYSLVSPGRGGAPVSSGFVSLTVINQYDEILTKGDDYDLSFKLVFPADAPRDARDYVSLNTATGEVTVKALAPACNFEVEIRAITKNGERSSTVSVDFTVTRDELKYTAVEVLGTKITDHEFSLPYPAVSRQLYAKGANQYNVSESVMEELDVADVEWRLTKVVFQDDSVATVGNASGGVYSAGSGAIQMTTGGIVTLGGATSKSTMPKAFTVEVTAKGQAVDDTPYSIGDADGALSKKSYRKTFTVVADASVATSIYITNANKQFTRDIPTKNATEPTTVTLSAEVQDQYGIRMNDATAALTWRIKEAKTGFSLQDNVVTIGYDVDPSDNVLDVEAVYGDLPTPTVKIYAMKDSSSVKVDSVRVDDVTLRGVSQPGNVISLPAKFLAGVNTGEENYAVNRTLLDNFLQKSPKLVSWTVDSIKILSEDGITSEKTWSGGIIVTGAGTADEKREVFVKFVNPDGSGKFRTGEFEVYYNETVRDALKAGKQVIITVRVTSDDLNEAGVPVTATGDIQLKLDQPVATTAKPVLQPSESREGSWDTANGYPDSPTVPVRGEENSIVILSEVYDQYGLVMENGGLTKMKIDGESVDGVDNKQMRFAQRSGANAADLTLKWQFSGQYIRILAWPASANETVADSLRIEVRPGPVYAASLVRVDNTLDVEIPYWSGNSDDRALNLPPAQNNVSLLDDLWAQVLNSKEEWMEQEAKLNADPRPVWKLLNIENYLTADGEATVRVPTQLDMTWNQNGPMTTITPGMDLKTEHMALEVTNRAAELVDQATNILQVNLDIHTSDHTAEDGTLVFKSQDEYFTKTVTLRLKRDEARPWYMFIQDVDEDGKLSIVSEGCTPQTSLKRPEKGQPDVTYTVTPQLFDQYGILDTTRSVGIAASADDPDVISLTLETDRLPDSDKILVEPVYEEEPEPDESPSPTASPSPEPSASPEPKTVIGYRIYHVEYTMPDPTPTPEPTATPDPGETPEPTPEPEPPQPVLTMKKLMAEFDQQTGELTITSDCDATLLNQVVIQAHYGPLNGDSANGKKYITIPFTQDPLRPASATLEHSTPEITISGEDGETEKIYDTMTPVVLDQYGEPYTGNMTVIWSPWVIQKDDDGNYVYDTPYTEFETKTVTVVDGEEETTTTVREERTRAEDRLIQMDSDLISAVLEVNPANYDEDRGILVRCVIYDPNNDASSANQVAVAEEVWVKKKKEEPKPGGGGYYAPSQITIRFDAGEYGQLVGPESVEIEAGSPVTEAPSVKSVEGYGFIGWTLDGEYLLDVTQHLFDSDATVYAVYKQISLNSFVAGYPDGTFRPNIGTTRAEFVTMVVNAMGGYDPDTDYGESFPDCDPARWYDNYVAYAKRMGLVAGYPDGMFRPNQLVTRAEAAMVLATASGLPLGNRESFIDVPENRWFSTAIAALKDSGTASGYKDGTFRPQQNITRAEAVTLIVGLTNNALDDLQKKNIKECGYSPFIDVEKGSWSFAYILRAAGVA